MAIEVQALVGRSAADEGENLVADLDRDILRKGVLDNISIAALQARQTRGEAAL